MHLIVEAAAGRFVQPAQLLAEVILGYFVLQKALRLVLVAQRDDGDFGVAGIGPALGQALVALLINPQINARRKH